MPLPTEGEVRTQLQNAVRMLRKGRNYAGLDAVSLAALVDTYVQSLEGEYAPECAAGALELRSRVSGVLGLPARILEPLLLQYNQIITGNHRSSAVAIGDVLANLYRYFAANAFTVESRVFAFGAPAAAGGNVGTGLLHRLTVDAQNFALEAQTPDGKRAYVVNDGNTGADKHAERFALESEPRRRDLLELQGSGRTTELVALSGRDSARFLNNPSFDQDSSGATAEGWIVSDTATGLTSANVTAGQTGATGVYRGFPGDLASSSYGLRLDNNVRLHQVFAARAGGVGPRFHTAAHYVQIAVYRAAAADGTLQLALANVTGSGGAGDAVVENAISNWTVSQAVGALVNAAWNIVRLPIDRNAWPERWSIDNLALMVKWTGRTVGTLTLDDVTMGELTGHDGSWYGLVGGQTPFQIGLHNGGLGDLFTWADTNADATTGFLQFFLWMAFGAYLPHTAGAATIADLADP